MINCNKKIADLKCLKLKCEYVYDDDGALYCKRKEKDILNEEICVMCGTRIPEGKMICNYCNDLEPSFNTEKVCVLLNKVTDIGEFVSLVSKCDDDVTIGSGRFAVNAKSIMGLYSLDLTKPLNVEFYGNIPYEVREGMKKFIID